VPQLSKPQSEAPQAGLSVQLWQVPGVPSEVLQVRPPVQSPLLRPQAVPQLSMPQSDAPQA